jgi:photosynthetic reaction center H subunit
MMSADTSGDRNADTDATPKPSKNADAIRVVPKDDNATAPPGELEHLSDLRGFAIADPEPDIRGWSVALADGKKVGKVDDLVIDTDSLAVRYIEVHVDAKALGADDDRWLLVPVGAARLDDQHTMVVVDRLPRTGLVGAPRFETGVPTSEQERQLAEYYGPATQMADAREGSGLYDQRRFWGARRRGREHTPYVVRSLGGPDVDIVQSVETELVVLEDDDAESGSRQPPGKSPGG